MEQDKIIYICKLLVKKFWNKYHRSLKKLLIDINDLEQEACIIAFTSLNKCKKKNEKSYISYISKCLRSRIHQMIKDRKTFSDRAISFPRENLIEKRKKLKASEFRIFNDYFIKKKTLAKIAQENKCSIYKIWTIKEKTKVLVGLDEISHFNTIMHWKNARKNYLKKWRKEHKDYFQNYRKTKKKILK